MDTSSGLEELVQHFHSVSVSSLERLGITYVHKHAEIHEVHTQDLENRMILKDDSNDYKETSSKNKNEIVSCVTFSF